MPIGINSKGELVGPPGWKPAPSPLPTIWDCGHPQNSQREGCPDPKCWRHKDAKVPAPTLGPNPTPDDPDERLAGLAEAEGLVLAMVQDMAAKEWEKAEQADIQREEATDETNRMAWEKAAIKHTIRAQVLGELELAMRGGQHRSAEYGDPDLARDRAKGLAKAHQRLANGLRGKAGSGAACKGGKKAARGMSKEERVRRARNAAESRYTGTKSNRKGEAE